MKYFFLIVIFCAASLSSCKNDQDGSGKGAIERHNEKMAQEAVRMIKTPLDQAKAAAEMENAHNKQMEDQLKIQ